MCAGIIGYAPAVRGTMVQDCKEQGLCLTHHVEGHSLPKHIVWSGTQGTADGQKLIPAGFDPATFSVLD